VPAARRLKEQVVREAMSRFAGIGLGADFAVLPVADPRHAETAESAAGLGWRTRGTLSVDKAGSAGFLAHRSHTVVTAGQCPQLHPGLAPLGLFDRTWPVGTRVGFVAPSVGEALAFDVAVPPGEPIEEESGGRTWAVAADGFWQVHPGAAQALVTQVRRLLAPQAGERLFDLYAGVGLFGLSLAAAPDGQLQVTLVEGDRRACELAEINRGQQPATIVRANVERWAARPGALQEADLVVLDPPRTGAGAAVTGAIAAAGPRAVAYVACDPVALARDVATFAKGGYALREIVALDLFPTTHHVECVALLVPQ
jgi:tRNA/tmRNA/rRNA uracil-C5-methylase (TrmA/RlmC/RlmD family)